MLHTVIPSINTEVFLKESVVAIYYLLQEAFRDAMTAHSAQLTKMRLPDRAIMLKAVSKAKNPILVKRKKMFKLGLVRDSFFYSICDSLYLCSKTPLNPSLFTAVLLKRLYYYIRHIHHAFMIIFKTSHTGLIMASFNIQTPPSLLTLSPFPLFLHWLSPLPFCLLFLFPASSISWAMLAVSISFCNLDFT